MKKCQSCLYLVLYSKKGEAVTTCFVSLLSNRLVIPADAWFVYTMFPLIRTRENVADVDCLGKRVLSLMSRHMCTMWYYSTDLSRHLLTSSDIFWHLLETSVEIPHSYISSPVLSLGISVSKMSEGVGRCQKMARVLVITITVTTMSFVPSRSMT